MKCGGITVTGPSFLDMMSSVDIALAAAPYAAVVIAISG
jgi:hypothetical protein